MRTDDFRPSDNVEDDREASASRGGMPGGAGGLGIGTVIIIGLISWYFGIDPSVLLNGAQILTGGGSSSRANRARLRRSPPARRTMPTGQFRRAGARRHRGSLDGDLHRQRPHLSSAQAAAVLRLGTDGGCGLAQSAMGPFYCPRDQRIYLDTVVLRRSAEQIRRLLGQQGLPVLGSLCDRARGRTSRAGRARHPAARDAGAEGGFEPRRRPMRCRFGSSCRPIASPACGRTAPSRSITSSIPATSIKPCRPPPPSATTGCRRRRRAMSCPTPSPTAPPSSASAGSRTASIGPGLGLRYAVGEFALVYSPRALRRVKVCHARD